MVAQQRDAFYGHFESAVEELPESLHVIGQIECPVLEISPSQPGSCTADSEKENPRGEARALFGVEQTRFSDGHTPCLAARVPAHKCRRTAGFGYGSTSVERMAFQSRKLEGTDLLGINSALSSTTSAVGIVDRSQTNKR
jgi:hypothetical protein